MFGLNSLLPKLPVIAIVPPIEITAPIKSITPDNPSTDSVTIYKGSTVAHVFSTNLSAVVANVNSKSPESILMFQQALVLLSKTLVRTCLWNNILLTLEEVIQFANNLHHLESTPTPR